MDLLVIITKGGKNSTLMNFERNSRVRIPSNRRNFHTKENNKLSETAMRPYFITGFTDAEGCFTINLRTKNEKLWAGLSYFLTQHSWDYLHFKAIKEFLGCGQIYVEEASEVVRFKVENLSYIGEHGVEGALFPLLGKILLLVLTKAEYLSLSNGIIATLIC